MAIISVSLPSDGSAATVSQYNTPVTTIVNAINGNLDSTNIASLSGTKITAGTITGTAFDTATAGGYIGGLAAPNTVTALGNRSYSMVFNTVDYTSKLSAGMRLRTTRTVAAPTQCTSLNGTTQYYSKTSPAGMTFTNNFSVGRWVKLTSYPASFACIESRYNGTSGWSFDVNSSGQVRLIGLNAGAGNNSSVTSYQSLPLNKWVFVSAQLDMSAFTATTTTSYVMLDGVDVPASVARAGTNPTALVQAGDYNIGAQNALLFWPGKLASGALFSAKVTQATWLTYFSQGFSGSETSEVSAYSFNNTINDLNTTNANNLTANGSAVATNADSPFGGQADGTISSTLDYAIIQKTAFSTNTTITVQVPEGCTIPTSGGVSAVSYSGVKAPYGMPTQRGKWQLLSVRKTSNTQSTPTQNQWYNVGFDQLNIPSGEWVAGYDYDAFGQKSAAVMDAQTTLSTANNTSSDDRFQIRAAYSEALGGTTTALGHARVTSVPLSLSSQATYYFNIRTLQASGTAIGSDQTSGPGTIMVENAYL